MGLQPLEAAEQGEQPQQGAVAGQHRQQDGGEQPPPQRLAGALGGCRHAGHAEGFSAGMILAEGRGQSLPKARGERHCLDPIAARRRRSV